MRYEMRMGEEINKVRNLWSGESTSLIIYWRDI